MKQEILDLLSANDYESAASHISALEKGEIVSLFGELKQEQVIPLEDITQNQTEVVRNTMMPI